MENTDVTILNNKNNQEGSPGEVFLKSFKKYNRKKGIDGNLWIVNAVNGQKFWQKITNYKLIDVKSVNTLRSTKECKTKSYISKNNIKKICWRRSPLVEIDTHVIKKKWLIPFMIY